MNNSLSNKTYGPLPLVIGITGHRDLRDEDVPALEQIVRGIFAEFRTKCPHTPLLLLSPLAEGADQLAARVAVAAADELGLRLIAPLPMRRALYEADFDKAAQAEFATLLAQTEDYFELPVVDGFSEADISQQGPARDHQYEQVGAYIARHSHVLIALWDGEYTNLVGGTSHIMQFQLHGVPEPYAPPRSPLDTVESGPVYHVCTPRRTKPLPKGAPLTLDVRYPQGYVGEAKEYDRIYARIDMFNRDVLKRAPRLAEELERNRNYLFPEAEAASLPAPARAQRERYAVADTLAIFFQRRSDRTLLWLYAFVLLAIILFDLYAHIEPDKHWLLPLYLACMLLPVGVYWWAKREDYQNKYQDYRALAEGMRVQFFWCLARLKLSVADHYLRKQKGELDWIRSAIRVWNIAEDRPNQPTAAPAPGARLALIRQHWVDAQAQYFRKAAHRDHARLERLERLINLLVWAGLLTALLLALLLLAPDSWREHWQELLHKYHLLHGLLLTLVTLLLAVAALIHSYIGKRALAEHNKQYGRMSRIFTQAEEHLRELLKNSSPDAADKLLVELGKEALEENGDWVMLHRERPLEVPHPG